MIWSPLRPVEGSSSAGFLGDVDSAMYFLPVDGWLGASREQIGFDQA
jgi:hypothetical protein